MKIPFPKNTRIPATTITPLSTDVKDCAEKFIIQAALVPGVNVLFFRMNADSTVPAAPYDETNAQWMYTLAAGASFPLEPSRGGELIGEMVSLTEIAAYASSATNVTANPVQRTNG